MPLGPTLIILGLPLIAGAIAIGRAIERASERSHVERMRALELGRPLPDGQIGATLVCLAVGGLVPVSALATGMMLAVSRSRDEVAVFGFLMLGTVGLTGIVGGMRLAIRLLSSRGKGTPPPEPVKPAFDPDAYLDPLAGARR
ncbi:hypothetical protein [Tautonia sociabilis]|uniref:Uncharacterized protein n=1 Tax=Tautonia sociabilis TaxID=2080755 RepID=A0A432MDF2_9BACT|nr:hypothetical protein [Tautonia sociabilis]RUL82337.1 hypothetical protein TsocGM_23570 [Tautonia sociabilis]